MTPEPQDLRDRTISVGPEEPGVVQADPELGPLARIIAVPLAPFVFVWEGGKALITKAIPAGAKAVGRLLLSAGRRAALVVRKVASFLLVPCRAVARLGRWVVAIMASWGRRLGCRAIALARSVTAVVGRLWSIAKRPLLAIVRRIGQFASALARPVAALAHRLGLALRGATRFVVATIREVARATASR